MAVWKKTDISFDIPLPIVLNDGISVFKYSSFSRAYHVYKERWQPTVGDGWFLVLQRRKRQQVRQVYSCDNLW